MAEDNTEDAVDVPEDADGASSGAHESSFLTQGLIRITGALLTCESCSAGRHRASCLGV